MERKKIEGMGVYIKRREIEEEKREYRVGVRVKGEEEGSELRLTSLVSHFSHYPH